MAHADMTSDDPEAWRAEYERELAEERDAIVGGAANDADHVERFDGGEVRVSRDEHDDGYVVVQVTPREGSNFEPDILALVRSQHPDEVGRETVADYTLVALRRPLEERDATLRYARQLVNRARPWEPTLVSAASSPSSAAPTWGSRLSTATGEWITSAPPPREYLARDVRTGRGAMPATGVAILAAAGGAGKSYATIGLALAVATGTPWLGVMRPERPGRVLIVSAEDPAIEIRRRVYAIARAYGIASIPDDSVDIIDVHDVHMPLLESDRGTITPTVHAAALATLVRQRGPYSLSIVDPVARISGASIDADNAAATALITQLEAISTAGGGLVVAVHHTGQTARRAGITDATALRGATGLGDGARMVMVLTVERIAGHDTDEASRSLSELVSVTLAKVNHVRRWEPIAARRDEHGVLVPMDAIDLEMVTQAREAADPSARRRAQRDEDRETREAKQATERERRAAEREAAIRARDAEDDRAVVEAIAASPDATVRALVAVVRGARACGSDRALAAVHRVRPTLGDT